MRRIAIACVVLAGSVRAAAQPPPADPVAPDPSTTPATPAPPSQAPDTQPTAEPLPGPGTPAPPPPGKPTASGQLDRALAEEQCAARDPGCDWLATLSSLERASVERALAARGFELEPAPWGKVIRKLAVYNEEVFAEPTPFLRFFNHFHVTTKESTITAETVVSAGELWDQLRIDETARRLRDPLWTSVVAVVPVRSPAPGTVDALIVTRDIWSLRLNTAYTFQEGKLTNLTTSLSENNFLGRRDVLAAALTMDQGSIAVGPLFIDKNLDGEHLNFQAQVADILNRNELTEHNTLHSEGTQSTITLSRPLWSLSSEWAAGATFTHRFAINRQFVGTGLRAYDYVDPTTMAVTQFGREYEMHQWDASAYVTRQWGTDIKSQLSFGHDVDSQRPRPLDSFDGTADQRAAFIANVLPRSEVTSVPYVEYVMFTPRYRTLRNITAFDLAEDLRTGPDLDVVFGVGLKFLGSDNNFERLSSAVGWTIPWTRDGFVRVATGLGGRHQDGEFIDNTATVSVRGASPPIAGAVRLLAQSSLSTRWHDTQNQFYALGSDTGLRGFAINQFTGQRYFDAEFEARTLPYPIWVLRVGAVAFYDLGDAANSIAQMQLHQDAGLGLRMLIPQTSAQLLKFDFAVPFDGPSRGTLRFLAGFGSEF
ncbi:MAG TPA: BamA/TamA family outer membrane protein [Kofleriaceae bacterium]|nr:BamA/TamA family outer membrane protein [Kofleriaceae bacterium]